MKHLIIDSEQEAILRQTLAGVASFLTARATRRDPMGFISKAYRLQERKVSNLEFQLGQPPIATWLDIPNERRAEFRERINAFLMAENDHYQALAYTQIHAFIVAQRAERVGEGRLSDKIKGVLPK